MCQLYVFPVPICPFVTSNLAEVKTSNTILKNNTAVQLYPKCQQTSKSTIINIDVAKQTLSDLIKTLYNLFYHEQKHKPFAISESSLQCCPE